MTARLLDKAQIAKRLAEIRGKIAAAAKSAGLGAGEIRLLAATKTVPAETVNYAADLGVDLIGENRVNELTEKLPFYSPKAERHFIGHLQTNKVNKVVGHVSLIQSVDSIRLAEEIGKQSVKSGLITPVLLEVNIGNEPGKFGFTKNEIFTECEKAAKISGISIAGLMAIPPVCETEIEIRRYFSQMRKLFLDIGAEKMDNVNMQVLSMGMSDDFEAAIWEGANLVRIGSLLFGSR